MSLAQPPTQDRQRPPSFELGTNNPFRARLSGTPISPDFPLSRPQSRNPFLDVFEDDDGEAQSRSIQKSSSFGSSTQTPALSGSAAELFENLTISSQMDESRSKMNRHPHPNAKSRPHFAGHQKSRSGLDDHGPLISVSPFGDEASRRPPSGGRRPGPPISIKSSGDRSREFRRRPRRNSDSSVIDAHESESRERSQRERRNRDGKSKGENSSRSRHERSSDRRKKNSALDLIDKLDVTGVYGSGPFHHDGRFDACYRHRNENSRRLAPVQAFPADSENNSLSGFGPVNMKADHSHIFGNSTSEAFGDYSSGGMRPSALRAASFDPKVVVETVHGEESLGLGTSTFLDGAPASRIAIEKNASETIDERRSSSDAITPGGALQRKKSLAQKIRSIKAGGPEVSGSSRRRPPPPPGGNRSPPGSGSPTTPANDKEGSYFTEYDDAYDKKGESIEVIANDRRERGPGSPRKPHPGVQRIGADDGIGGNGLLKRVWSLSKPKRRTDI